MYEEALQIAEKRREVKGKGERERYTQLRASMVAQMIKNLPTMQETRVQSLGWEDPLEKGKATLSSILAWRSHEQRSLVGYSVWGCRKSDMAEQLSTQTHTHPTECRVPENSKERQGRLLSEQCKEIKENDRIGETAYLFKKTGDTKGKFHATMCTIKDRNCKDLTET